MGKEDGGGGGGDSRVATSHLESIVATGKSQLNRGAWERGPKEGCL